MRQLLFFSLVALMAWAVPLESEAGVVGGQRSWLTNSGQTDQNTLEVAKKKKRRKKKKKKKKKKKGGGAPADVVPVPETPPVEEGGTPETTEGTGAPTEGGESTSGDWGTPDWSGAGATTDAAAPAEGGADTELTSTETEIPEKPYKRVRGMGGAFIWIRPMYTMGGRNFDYANSQTTNLRPYKAKFVSQAGLHLDFFPFALLEMSGLDGIGVRGGYNQAIGLKSSPKADPSQEFTTSWFEFDAGLCYRLNLDDAMLIFGVDYGNLAFELTVPDDSTMAGQVQNLKYSFARVGVDFRYSIKPLSVLVGVAYRQVLSSGPLQDEFFPKESVLALDGHAGIGFALLDFLEVSLEGSGIYFSHSLKPAGDAYYIAESATDLYWGARLGATVFF